MEHTAKTTSSRRSNYAELSEQFRVCVPNGELRWCLELLWQASMADRQRRATSAASCPDRRYYRSQGSEGVRCCCARGDIVSAMPWRVQSICAFGPEPTTSSSIRRSGREWSAGAAQKRCSPRAAGRRRSSPLLTEELPIRTAGPERNHDAGPDVSLRAAHRDRRSSSPLPSYHQWQVWAPLAGSRER